MVYFQVSNSIDSRVVNITINKNGSLLKEEQITVTGRGSWYSIINYDLSENVEYVIDYQAFDKDTQQFIENKSIKIDNNYL